jgi:hypothetical protein
VIGNADYRGSYHLRKSIVTRKRHTVARRNGCYFDCQGFFCLDHEGSLLASSSDGLTIMRSLILVHIISHLTSGSSDGIMRACSPLMPVRCMSKHLFPPISLPTQCGKLPRGTMTIQERISEKRIFSRPYCNRKMHFNSTVSTVVFIAKKVPSGQ